MPSEMYLDNVPYKVHKKYTAVQRAELVEEKISENTQRRLATVLSIKQLVHVHGRRHIAMHCSALQNRATQKSVTHTKI